MVVLLAVASFIAIAGFSGARKVAIGVTGDFERAEGMCNVIVSGTPINGEGLTEDAAVIPLGGSITESLFPGRYTATAYCQDEEGAQREGEVNFIVFASAADVTITAR
ncbi:hypothetical protein [Marisediminicola sp. LYQ134]|uniref:hypothetical protein n=1 Tax=Marisediminicola sp. LYQ134 TaxID=3391061 RepID=UPI0039830F61